MPRARLYATDAEKQAAYRARHNTKTLNVQIPIELMEQLDEYMKFKCLTKAEVITKLLTQQLLRKR